MQICKHVVAKVTFGSEFRKRDNEGHVSTTVNKTEIIVSMFRYKNTKPYMSQLMRLWYLWIIMMIGEQRRHPRSLARAIAVRTHKVWKQTKGLAKNQTCSPSGLLRMRICKLSLRRVISELAHITLLTCSDSVSPLLNRFPVLAVMTYKASIGTIE